MAVDIRKLTNANVYFDGANWLGKVEEVGLPEVALKQIEHKAIGMHGTLEIPTGMDKMELKMKWSSLLPDALKKASNGYQAFEFQVRSSLEEYEGGTRTTESSVVANFRGRPKNVPAVSFKQHENVDAETMFAVDYYKLEIGGESIYEIDATNNIYKVNGVDLLATYRANLGI